MANYKQKEREIIITQSDKPAPDDMPIHFVNFFKEMGRVIEEREERERQARK